MIPTIEQPLRDFLVEISSRVVVVGSVACGVRWPKDLDLLWDLDSSIARKKISEAIRKHRLKYVSVGPGCWTFYDYGWMVELIPFHDGPNYRTLRRAAQIQTVLGIEFFVAQEKK